MYKIIGADGKEYGPITSEQMRQWIAESRANAQTRVQVEGSTEWTTLGTIGEFAGAFGTAPMGAFPPQVPVTIDAEGLAAEILARDYHVDIGGCIGRSWQLVKANFWLLVGASFVASIIAGIPYLGIVLAGPMMGGLYLLYLSRLRGQPAGFETAFKGFSLAFLQLMLVSIVSTVLTGLGLVLCILPGVYLAVSWMFALALVIDKRMEFWAAMELSRKVVTKHWWAVFGLALVAGLVGALGLIACVIGIFITLPIAFGAIAYAYEDIFGRPAAPTV